ncbi:MAG: efflux RND transporter periplasmic adaptor subunit, partial [Myxococcota bacterium]
SARSVQAPSQPSAPAPVAARPPARPAAVTALGRLEPKDGLIRVAGPSAPSVVIAKLFVEEGDRVEAGQVLAQLDTFEVRQAAVEGVEAELANAQAELRRNLEMDRKRVISRSLREQWELRVKVAQADLNRARAELERTRVHAPIDGAVIRIHAREGERVGSDGILELGRTDQMFAIAEVYETDIPGIRIGQRAKVMSPVFEAPLAGEVEWIRLKIGKLDVLGVDPAAKTDARVVEVEVRLDESAAVAGLTNLQVEIEFER